MKRIGLLFTILTLTNPSIFPIDNIENLTPHIIQSYFVGVFDMVNALQSRLTLANKHIPSDILGTEIIDGYISGTLTYEAKLKGVGVDVTIIYDNFSDTEGWIFDGKVISHAKVVGKGSYEGEIKVSGLYPGLIKYCDVKSKLGYPTEGTFEVVLDGYATEMVDLQNALSTKL